MSGFPIVVSTPLPFAYVLRSAVIADVPKTMGEGFATLSSKFAEAKAGFGGPPLAHYLSFDGNSTTFELGFPVHEKDVLALRAAGLSIGQTASGKTMKGLHVGPYDTVVETYNAMQAAMKAQGVTGASDMWECYFSPPETPPAEIRTEVIWPVRAAA